MDAPLSFENEPQIWEKLILILNQLVEEQNFDSYINKKNSCLRACLSVCLFVYWQQLRKSITRRDKKIWMRINKEKSEFRMHQGTVFYFLLIGQDLIKYPNEHPEIVNFELIVSALVRVIPGPLRRRKEKVPDFFCILKSQSSVPP